MFPPAFVQACGRAALPEYLRYRRAPAELPPSSRRKTAGRTALDCVEYNQAQGYHFTTSTAGISLCRLTKNEGYEWEEHAMTSALSRSALSGFRSAGFAVAMAAGLATWRAQAEQPTSYAPVAITDDFTAIEQPHVWTFGVGAVRHPGCAS